MRPTIILLILLVIPLNTLFSEGTHEEQRDGGIKKELDNEYPLIDVPWYSQTEEWGEDYLGDSRIITLRTHGCALSCTAMVFQSYGIQTDPRKLNKALLKSDAYEKGWDDDSGEYLGRVRINWDMAAAAFKEIASFKRHNFSNSPADMDLIRSYLDEGIPVIAEVLRPRGIPHFVVIRAYTEDDFLIRDPLNEELQLLGEGYSISDEHGSGAERNIYGIRVFYPADS